MSRGEAVVERKRGQPSALPRIMALALFFLAGVFLGQVLARRVPASVGQELTAYLQSYLTLEESAVPALSALVLYFRYPALAVVLGFGPVGTVALPCVTAAFGCSLSFSVCCFTAAFGADGVLLALATFGLRCAVTLPVYLLLAAPAWGSAAASVGGGRRKAPVLDRRSWWLRVAVCAGILLAGVCLELTCGPALLRPAVERALR